MPELAPTCITGLWAKEEKKMSSVIGLKVRASILRTPGDGPGLLFVDGRQWPFTLDNLWKSPVAPSVNMLVDVDFDVQGNITAIAAVDPQQAAKEKLNQIGGEAKEQVDKPVVIASRGVGALASRRGKGTLCLPPPGVWRSKRLRRWNAPSASSRVCLERLRLRRNPIVARANFFRKSKPENPYNPNHQENLCLLMPPVLVRRHIPS
jgi:hypothetical protein